MGFGLLWFTRFTIPAERGSPPSDRVMATTAKNGHNQDLFYKVTFPTDSKVIMSFQRSPYWLHVASPPKTLCVVGTNLNTPGKKVLIPSPSVTQTQFT